MSNEISRIIANFLFHANTQVARLYRKGCSVITAALVVCAASSLLLRFWLRAENKKLDRAEDGEVHSFRYIL